MIGLGSDKNILGWHWKARLKHYKEYLHLDRSVGGRRHCSEKAQQRKAVSSQSAHCRPCQVIEKS